MLLRHRLTRDSDRAFELNGLVIPVQGYQIDVPDEVGRLLLKMHPRRVAPWTERPEAVPEAAGPPGLADRRTRRPTPPPQKGGTD